MTHSPIRACLKMHSLVQLRGASQPGSCGAAFARAPAIRTCSRARSIRCATNILNIYIIPRAAQIIELASTYAANVSELMDSEAAIALARKASKEASTTIQLTSTTKLVRQLIFSTHFVVTLVVFPF